MKDRLLSALVALPALVGLVWLGGIWLAILTAAIAALGAREFYAMASRAGFRSLAPLGASLAAFTALAAWTDEIPPTLPLAATVLLPLIFVLREGDIRHALGIWAITLAGVIYIGWTLSLGVALRGIEDGREWLLLALLATFACDTSAFLLGRATGRRPLAPHISPGKTWEGAWGGLTGAMGATMALKYALGLDIAVWQAVLLGGLVGIFAQLGDLAESALKRSAGVKEAGSLIPGHGGILDRLDSVIFGIVVAYIFATWPIG